MKAPLSWLKEYVDVDVEPNILADKLVSVGFEVEEIIKEYYRKALQRVSFTWRNYWRDSTHAGHYSHELRKVTKIERITNILAVDKAFRHYYDRQIKGTMPSKLRVILWKQIWLTVKDKG